MTVFISFDVETTGPSPVNHNMLSLGAVADVAVADDLTDLVRVPRIGEFSINLRERHTHGWDSKTRDWWHHPDQAEALAATLAVPRVEPAQAMQEFMDWIARVRTAARENHATGNTSISPVVFVARPIAFDMCWLHHYAHTYVPCQFNALGRGAFSAVDIMTMLMVLQQRVPHLTSTKPFQALLDDVGGLKHTALSDAKAQAALFKQLLRAHKEVNDGYVFTLMRSGAFTVSPDASVERPKIVYEDGTERDL